MLLRVMPVSDRKARFRVILVFFGLDPAPPNFRHDRPPRGADALGFLRARYSSSRTPDLVRKNVLQKGRNVLLYSMWKRACGGL